MTAYVVLIRESAVTDPEALRAYRDVPDQAAARPASMRALAYYGNIEALEGKAPDGVVIFAFPDVEAAQAWYYSEQYQTRVPLRRQAAEYRGFIVEGLGFDGDTTGGTA